MILDLLRGVLRFVLFTPFLLVIPKNVCESWRYKHEMFSDEWREWVTTWRYTLADYRDDLESFFEDNGYFLVLIFTIIATLLVVLIKF